MKSINIKDKFSKFDKNWHPHQIAIVDDMQVLLAKVKDELADVLSFAFLIANNYGFDIGQIIDDKISKNEIKYPIDKAKGNAKKYNEL